MIFRIWSFADITLTDQQDEQARESHRSWDENGDASDDYRNQPLSDVEKDLRRAYHAATLARDRMDVLEAWTLCLLRTWSDMTDQEQKIYRRRVESLLRIARTMLAIEARRAKIELYEDHLGAVEIPSRKIILHTWKDELTRIHEAARAADLYADTTTVAQIVGMYHVERLPKDIEASYRSSRSRTENHRTPSEKFLTFIKKLVRQLTPALREKLID
ncbi:MAG: hypothetical protein ABI876_08595 [Bacteroidota bacterium]